MNRRGRKKGSIPWNKGLTKEDPRVNKCFINNSSLYKKGENGFLGHRRTEEWKKKFSVMMIEKYKDKTKHPRWIQDRSKLKLPTNDNIDRRSSIYNNWRHQVWLRDGFKCKIANPDCYGKIIAHHILPWRDYVELRYEVNNGITLCCFHHPRKRDEEKRLSPYFIKLIKENTC